MITQIGIVAGEIWSFLEGNNKESKLENIISGIDRNREMVLMSIGWLAREGHVVLEGDEPDYMVRLTNEKGKKNE
jgi:hypothetical protein